MTRVKFACLGVLALAAAATPLLLLRQAHVALADKDEALRAKQEEIAQLIAENDRLSNLLSHTAAVATPAPGQPEELLRLRAEVTRLTAEQDLAKSKSASLTPAAQAAGPEPGDPTTAREAQVLVAKVNTMKQAFDRMPPLKIPELAGLSEKAWLRVALERPALDNDNDIRDALCRVRDAAKQNFVSSITQALQKYTQASNGELPTDFSQLKSYFDPPVDDSVLQRYQMLKSGNVNDLQRADLVVGEKAPVDSEYDMLYQIGLASSKAEGVGKRSGQRSSMSWDPPTAAPSPGGR